MHSLPEDTETPASRKQIIGTGIGSLIMGGMLLYVTGLLGLKIRSVDDVTSFPFIVLFGLTAFPGLALVGIAIALFKPQHKQAPQMMGSFILYVIGSIFLLYL